MKKIILLLPAILIFSKCSAQTRLRPGEIKGERDTFIINKLGEFDAVKYIDIYSKSNKYNKGIPPKKGKERTALPMLYSDIHVNKDAIAQIVYGVLKDKLGALKQNKENINMRIDFEPDGNLTDISFTLHENTLITLQEIEKIDQGLRDTIKASFTGIRYKDYIAIDYYVPRIQF